MNWKKGANWPKCHHDIQKSWVQLVPQPWNVDHSQSRGVKTAWNQERWIKGGWREQGHWQQVQAGKCTCSSPSWQWQHSWMTTPPVDEWHDQPDHDHQLGTPNFILPHHQLGNIIKTIINYFAGVQILKIIDHAITSMRRTFKVSNNIPIRQLLRRSRSACN